MEAKCYWCDKKATSDEHVPLDVYFLKTRMYGIENLITVPSCDEHNMQKSQLDEYLTVTLYGKVGNNGLA